MEGISDQLNLADFTCIYCHAVGELTNKWPVSEEKCPRCGKKTLQMVGSYIT